MDPWLYPQWLSGIRKLTTRKILVIISKRCGEFEIDLELLLTVTIKFPFNFCERYPLKVVHRIVDKIYKLEMRPYFYGSGSWKWFSNNLKKRIKYKQYFFQNNLTMSTWFEFKLHYFDMSRKILNLLQTDSCIYFSWTFSKLFFLCG